MNKIESIKFPKPNISKSHRKLFENEKVRYEFIINGINIIV